MDPMINGIGDLAGRIAGAGQRPELEGASSGGSLDGFADAIQTGLETVSDMEFASDAAIADFAAGGATSVTELMVANSKAQLGIEMLSTVRDRAVEAYQEIMRMQV